MVFLHHSRICSSAIFLQHNDGFNLSQSLWMGRISHPSSLYTVFMGLPQRVFRPYKTTAFLHLSFGYKRKLSFGTSSEGEQPGTATLGHPTRSNVPAHHRSRVTLLTTPKKSRPGESRPSDCRMACSKVSF